jgi:hypothetical protein
MRAGDDIVKMSFDIEATDLIDFALLAIIKRGDPAEYRIEAPMIIERLGIWLDLLEANFDKRDTTKLRGELNRVLNNTEKD